MRKHTLKTGDIFIDGTGFTWINGKKYFDFDIFEYRECENEGKGFRYNRDGSETYYYWARPEESMLFKNVPKDIMFSFKHGSSEFQIKREKLEKCKSISEIVRKSNFQFRTPEEIRAEDSTILIQLFP